MSPYVFGGLLITFVAWSGFMYYEGHSNEATQCKADNGQATVAAYEHKDEVTNKQTAITTSEVSIYEKDSSVIGTLYSDSLPSTPIPAGVPNVPGTPIRVCPNSSKRYKFTFKQCDIEEAKLKGLFDRDTKLSAVK